jgi:hypothetical protein
MTWLDPSFPAYRDALERQFLKLVEVGADGLHVDKMFPTPMDFNPRCELGPDVSTWEGAIRLTQRLVEKAQKINPEFALSVECNWDRMLQFANAIWWVGNMSLARSVFPEMVETRAVLSPYDYLGVNNAVRLSQVGLLAPLNCSRSLAWEPWKGLSQYVRDVKQVQQGLSEAVFFGEVLGPTQIRLGHEPRYGIELNVFRSLKSGKRVCILTNSDREEQTQVIRAFAGNEAGAVRIHVPCVPPRDAALPVKVTVPAERIVFVEELSAGGGPGSKAVHALPPDAGPANANWESPDHGAGRIENERRSIKLENDRYRVEVNRTNGAITRILDKAGKLELIREPRLAGNFKFTLPLPGKEPWETIEANYILGKEQTLSSFDVRGQKLTLSWRKPLASRSGGKHDVGATMEIELQGEAVRFALQIENQTPNMIGEVFFPILGGVTGLGDRYRELKSTRLLRPAATGVTTSDPFFIFANFSDLGDQGAEQFYLYPKDLTEPWMEFESPAHRRFVYLGAHDPAGRSQVLHLELVPGNAATPRWDGNWPRREELGGLPAGILVSFVHFANHAPGKTYEAAPVILQVHDGDWHTGQRIYQKWRSSR